jgi:hypothetical protein
MTCHRTTPVPRALLQRNARDGVERSAKHSSDAVGKKRVCVCVCVCVCVSVCECVCVSVCV